MKSKKTRLNTAPQRKIEFQDQDEDEQKQKFFREQLSELYFDEELAGTYVLDRLLHAFLGQLTFGISPGSLSLAFMDWLIQLGFSPGKNLELTAKIWRKYVRFLFYIIDVYTKDEAEPCIKPLPQDHRFRTEAWSLPPFNFIYQGFLLCQQWWHNATTDIPGVSEHHERVVSFTIRQILDVFSPSNFIMTNPEVFATTIKEGGYNLFRGLQYWLEDNKRKYLNQDPIGLEQFKIGENIAATEGKVIFRNHLIELIQYQAKTSQVYPEPILIVPAWIMKYYILDLSHKNSLVRYLVEKGHTVFMISWKNPKSEDRDLSFDDYRRLGVMDALKVISAILPKKRIHLAGYCLGGTLSVISAADMANKDDDRLKSLTLFAAQIDFDEGGELMLFIDEGQIEWLEDMMWERGYLDKERMAMAFQLLRSNDLIWSRLQTNYLMGEREDMFDLKAWDEDATRMPYRMHSEYLRKLFLNNDLAEGKITIDGQAIAITNIHTPILAVATEKDHVSPWRSVYKIHLLADTEVTFILSNGGHNAGIVSEPGHPGRMYRIRTRKADEEYISSKRWYYETHSKKGSWWPAWQKWLVQHSTKRKIRPPKMGAPDKGYVPLYNAPGQYVLMK